MPMNTLEERIGQGGIYLPTVFFMTEEEVKNLKPAQMEIELTTKCAASCRFCCASSTSARKEEIFVTATPGDRAKQIVLEFEVQQPDIHEPAKQREVSTRDLAPRQAQPDELRREIRQGGVIMF